MKDSLWVLVETEATGSGVPEFAIGVSAQRMRGWMPEGPPFHRLLDRNVDIPPEATRAHGYTREILERDGEPAEAVYEAFADYVQELPLVAYPCITTSTKCCCRNGNGSASAGQEPAASAPCV